MKLTFKDLLLQNKLGALADIPEWKRIGWSEEGQLELQDDLQPKDVTERIKTFDDALAEVEWRAKSGTDLEARRLYYNYRMINEAIITQEKDKELMVYLQLRIIICALNEGWTPQFTENERRWYPYFTLWTEDELKDKSDEWKDDHQLLRWGGLACDGSRCGVACSISYDGWSHACVHRLSPRL